MMGYTERFTERFQLLATIYGANVDANTESNSGYVDVSGMYRVWAAIHPVSLNDALDVDFEEAKDTSGTSAQSFNSAGKDTTIAATDTAPTIFEVKGEEFDVADKMTALNVEVTTADTAGDSNYFVVEIWGEVMYAPADTTNLDAVVD